MIRKNPTLTFEFHIAKDVRRKYQIDEELFTISGNLVLADFKTVRLFTQKINSFREEKDKISAGAINASGLLDEIYHYLFRLYEQQANPGVFNKAINYLNTKLGEEKIRKLLFDFNSVFPPTEVYKGKSSIFNYLNSFSADRSNLEITLEEIILLYFSNFNTANKKIIELFDENYLQDIDLFRKIISELDLFFQKEKRFGPNNDDIFTFLKAPIINHPENIEAQLDFIREKYGVMLDEKFLRRILLGKDLIREEFLLGFGGTIQTAVPKYKPDYDEDFLMLGKSGYKYSKESWKDFIEPENFTSDIPWMPNVVLLAKNVYVWMDQLSKKYQRHIKTLDQIPDEELDQLAKWHFNGLWLIGIWERSSASKKIKHILGNIDAVSSAYSLYDYQIANDLGSEWAYQNLNQRARARGIRLASDMVPNHTGIFSRWIIEHPEYFIQSDYPPFPNYSFNGENLSDDWSVQLRIEDGYWSRRDAAVVFQRIDNRTGEMKYIYHGNDGTNMPWNDTAQLNMIRHDVREAVIQKILDVARKFSIIRFDAAMTLTKRHYSRLWYPEPGKGGDIPSRSDFAMTKNEFDIVFPNEFWREVVDRINSEMPDTLLLAEAFWLMEGYFVRSLGMHRVYNSAFMHMMMKEENAKYRDLISNTLEFEPEILKRYVNFMSNPDEETAIKQFGTDDKYFGICTLMVTLPGLPMFAHGQIEGYTEKYGMEYQRAYYNETTNHWLVDRHQREIFPLMHKRYLFSEVKNFWLFDFINHYGGINENVFAFTNSAGNEKALVIYNNKYEFASGKIFTSSPKLVNQLDGNKRLETRTIAEALGINSSDKHFYIYKEHISNLEFIKTGSDIARNGISVELGAFKYQVYINWSEVYDNTGDWAKLAWKFGSNGVPSIWRAFQEMKFEPLHYALENIFNENSVNGFITTFILEEDAKNKLAQVKFIEENYSTLIKTVTEFYNLDVNIKTQVEKFDDNFEAVRKLKRLLDEIDFDAESVPKVLQHAIQISSDNNYHDNSILLMIILTLSGIKNILPGEGGINKNNFIDEMLLDSPLSKILRRFGRGENDLYHELELVKILVDQPDESIGLFNTNNFLVLDSLLNNDAVKKFLGVNNYEGVWYYSQENFEELLDWLFTLSCLSLMAEEIFSIDIKIGTFNKYFENYKKIKELSLRSEYKLEIFKSMIK